MRGLVQGFPSALMLLLATALGCGSQGERLQVTPVSGVVTLDGQPLAGASIIFLPEQSGGNGAAATSGADGKYEAGFGSHRGVRPGTYKVTVEHWVPKKEGAPVPDLDQEQLKQAGYLKLAVPAQYANPEKTPLTVTVKDGGAQTENLEVKSK